jgi:fructuronate reductase
MGAPRLSRLATTLPGVARPGFAPEAHGAGIVHIGVGAFHRAHQAVYTDDALAAAGGDWRITGVSLRSTDIADALNPQDGLYTLIVRDPAGTRARIVGSIARVIAAAREPGATLAALADPATRIVTTTVTEKAYGIARGAGVDPANPAIAADLANPRFPSGVIGLLVEALRLRRAAGDAPFTVLCCDNLPDNGALLCLGVVDFAGRIDPALADWIAAEGAFPSSMVDRITPAPTATTLALARELAGCEDMAAVETEPFSQWVIEDRFVAGRPRWEAGGALFVEAIAPYERMKLRMLNGTHSMLAYCGYLTGCAYVRDVMARPDLAALVGRHLAAARSTLESVGGIDLGRYAEDLRVRFANPAIAHQTYQIAMDGTEKLPQRIFEPALELLGRGAGIRPFAFAAAAWMRYCLGRTDAGETYALRDPREAQIRRALEGAGDAAAISAALTALPGFVPERLAAHPVWRAEVEDALGAMLSGGMAAAVRAEAAAAAVL